MPGIRIPLSRISAVDATVVTVPTVEPMALPPAPRSPSSAAGRPGCSSPPAAPRRRRERRRRPPHRPARSRPRTGPASSSPAACGSSTDSGVYDDGGAQRVLTEGARHGGIFLRFGGESHHVDFEGLVGESVLALPADRGLRRPAPRADPRRRRPAVRRHRHRGARRGGHPAGDLPRRRRRGAGGRRRPGGRCRRVAQRLPRPRRRARTPLARPTPSPGSASSAEAPKSAPELIYARSERGFALISQRTDDVQRMYFQCDPHEDADGLVRRPDLGRAADAAVGAGRLRAAGGADHRAVGAAVPQLRPDPDAARPAAARRRRRAHRPADRREGAQPRARRRPACSPR